MSNAKTEPQHKGEFLVSEGNGEISREVGVLTAGQKVGDGRLLSVVGGKLVVSTGHLNSGGASDEVFAGFAYGATDASVTGPGGSVDTPVVYIARLAEVKTSNVVLHAVAGGGAAAATAAVKVAIAKLFLFLR